MLQEKINKIIPHIADNFITYPLSEDGVYAPYINFWQICKNQNELLVIKKLIRKIFDIKKFEIEIEKFNNSDAMSQLYYISISPRTKELSDGGYEFVDKMWSIEKIISLFDDFLKEKRKHYENEQTEF